MNAPKIAPTRLPHTADALIGRECELALLHDAWNDPARHVLVVRGIGGEGKTSLVAEWAAQLSDRGYDGASYFDWSFYSQGTRDQPGASSGPFVAAALTFFGEEEGAALANSPASGRDKATKLLEYLRARRTLLILDGLEPLQYPPGPHTGRLRDEEMTVLLKGLAQNFSGLCVVTTREPVTDLVRFQRSTAPELELERLSEGTGSAVLLRLFEPATPKGVHHVRSTPAERVEIVRAVRGHALTLRLLGGYVHKFLRDVRRWREVDYAQADAAFLTNPNSPEARYGHAFKTIEVYERWLTSGGVRGEQQLAVLRLLGLFDRPAIATSLAALRAEPAIAGLTDLLVGLSAEEWNATLSELEECGLISVPRAGLGELPLDAHPLLREYFARRLRIERSEAWREGHRRLFEHLCATTKEGEEPTLEALQPLYQAVAHGCAAELHQQACATVYHDRILRGEEFYSTRKLGAFASDLGAVACFFEAPWSRVSPALSEDAQAWLLNQAAFRLSALGRLTEALVPMRIGLQMAVQQEDWKNAAQGTGTLSGLRLALGDVAGAVADAQQAVIFADRSSKAFERMALRTTHAEALHQCGCRDEAEALFRQAEDMQVQRQPKYSLLYSVQGFRYCDLLLADAERAVWRPAAGAQEDMRAVCRDVARRAKQMFEWQLPSDPLLEIAVHHLTLGRAALFEALLGGSDFGAVRVELDTAVAGLRSSGRQDELPRGLPGTRVEAHRLTQYFGNKNVTQLLDGQASRVAIDKLRIEGKLATFRYVHLATHLQSNRTDPFRSALLLADPRQAGEAGAGQLSPAEVLREWKITADLVTLAGCGSTIGTPAGGDGFLGFTLAFLACGSRSVCATLWNVDDAATALLMDRFYLNLLGKQSGLPAPLPKAEALAEAKRWLRDLSREGAAKALESLSRGVTRPPARGPFQPLALPSADGTRTNPYADPYYWAGFVLVGDPE